MKCKTSSFKNLKNYLNDLKKFICTIEHYL